MMYCRRFLLINCGRFIHVASDFGSKYHTHIFVTPEALYASLTREQSRVAKRINLMEDNYDFNKTYDLRKIPIWFSPGIFVSRNVSRDFSDFNVVNEVYPRTDKYFDFDRKTKLLKQSDRPYFVPTYGSIEGILPGQVMETWGFSKSRSLIEAYQVGQNFMLGKKRTMFQLIDASEIGICEESPDGGQISWVTITVDGIKEFYEYEVLVATARYLLVRGMVNKAIIRGTIYSHWVALPKDSFPSMLFEPI